MARQNSKPGARSGKAADEAALPERQLKVVAGFYDYPPPKQARYRPGRTTVVPQLRLKGKWLEQAGFTLDMPVRVIVRKGRLVVEAR